MIEELHSVAAIKGWILRATQCSVDKNPIITEKKNNPDPDVKPAPWGLIDHHTKIIQTNIHINTNTEKQA